MATERTAVDVEGRHLTLSNLGKVLFPESGTTKGEMLAYYRHVAPLMVPHLRGRPVTFRRAPDGVAGGSFYEKNVPKGAPDWFTTLRVPSNGRVPATGAGGGTGGRSGGAAGRAGRGGRNGGWIEAPGIDGLPALMWAANMAVIEFHVPMWRVDRRGAPRRPDLLVFDLDPGEGTGITECCRVALLVRAALAGDGLTALAKTSGSKGLQLYAAVPSKGVAADTLTYAHRLAMRLEDDHRGHVVSNMRKDLRRGKVLIDWSQNNPSKTTVAPYSLRLLPSPTASTPVTWEEVSRAADGRDPLRFTAADVMTRVDAGGDLFAPLLAAP